MLVWINNNFENISTDLFELGMVSCFVMICLIPILEKYLWSRFISLLGFFIMIISISLLFSVLVSGYLPGNFGKAIRGEYGQKWVITSKFEANKSPKQLQKILKNNDGENNFATYDIRVWHRGKEYSGINIKSKEGNNKIVFSYLEPTMKGIKVNKNKAYIYIYHKKAKPQPKVFKYGEE